MINRVVLTVSDVTSCTGAVEVLAKGVSIVHLVVRYITLSHSGCEYYRGSVCISWKYPRSVYIICVLWKYPRSVNIIRTHTSVVGHVTSTRRITLSTALYYPL